MTMTEFANITQNIFQGIGKFFSVKFVPSIIIPVFSILFGVENDNILRALLLLIGIDFFTGIMAARRAGEVIKSKSAVRSAFKVAVYGLLISAGHLTEQITPLNTFIEEAVISFLAITELISIIENVGKMGYAIPKKLLQKLQKLRDEETVITEKTIIKEKVNPETKVVETHTVQEKKTESHVSEKTNHPTT